MQTTALLRFPSSSSLSSHPSSKFSSYPLHKIKCSSASSNVEINDGKLLSAKDRRKMRNERREEAISSKPPWREVVEERLLATPKMPNLRYLLNLDTLAEEGVSWWTLCVRKTSERSAAKNLFIEFRRQYPDAELEIFVPEVPFRKEMKDGSYSKRMKILFPGYIFIKCLLNKEIHDLIRYSPSIRGFSGTKVGNSTRWIMRPNPISNAKIEEMLKRVNEEKEKCSQEIEDELLKEKRNKKKDNLVRQEHTEAITHKDFSIAKNANFRTDLAKELSKINRSGIQIGSSDANLNSKNVSEAFTETYLKLLRKQKSSNGRDKFPSKKKYKLIERPKVASGHVKKFDLET